MQVRPMRVIRVVTGREGRTRQTKLKQKPREMLVIQQSFQIYSAKFKIYE